MPTHNQEKKRSASGRKYTVYFLRDQEAGGYTAHIPALGIVTDGETLREARMMARDAIEGRLAVLKELGEPIPKDINPELLEV